MAYDRYDTRGGSRERWRSDDEWRDRDRERGHGRGDERGFFERAKEEFSNFFGGDDDDRGRRGEMGREHRYTPGWGSDAEREVWESRERGGRWDRDQERGGFNRDRSERDRFERDRGDRGFFGSSSTRGLGSESGRGESMWSGDRSRQSDRSYRPMAGDYGRSDDHRESGRSNWDRDEYRRTSFAGSSERNQHHDPHYAEWRRRQLEELDRDYDEYRREHQSKFESDFGGWRERRQSKRQLLGQAREHMEVVGSDGEHVGTIDRIAGDRIILTKSDAEAGGVHHSIPCTSVDRIEGDRVMLDSPAAQAKQRWREEGRERALFERQDQGESGPMNLERSFSGTYRDE